MHRRMQILWIRCSTMSIVTSNIEHSNKSQKKVDSKIRSSLGIYQMPECKKSHFGVNLKIAPVQASGDLSKTSCSHNYELPKSVIFFVIFVGALGIMENWRSQQSYLWSELILPSQFPSYYMVIIWYIKMTNYADHKPIRGQTKAWGASAKRALFGIFKCLNQSQSDLASGVLCSN